MASWIFFDEALIYENKVIKINFNKTRAEGFKTLLAVNESERKTYSNHMHDARKKDKILS